METTNKEPKNISPDTNLPQKDFKDVWKLFKEFIRELLDIRNGADTESTVNGIKKDIPFKGHTAWILIFSIVIASIGLNTNSTAVVIGAMLISPLMGPILGIGLSVGINDIDTLRRSVVNFGVMVFLSILTAFIYFKISPFQIASSEILARTEPTLLDVVIALFGGLAGIVAGSRKEKSNAIPGVAIATALMPPLCTAGFGLATGNIKFFLGALFLFGINTVFIALSTFVVVKYLRFPMARYANTAKRKRVNRIVIVVALLFIIPSIWSFLRILDRTLYEKQAQVFVDENVIYNGSEKIKYNVNFENKIIEVLMIGNTVPQNIIDNWQTKINEEDRIKGSELKIRQGQDKTNELALELSNKVKEGVLKDLYAQSNKQLSDKDAKILLLENEVNRLSAEAKKIVEAKKNSGIPIQKIAIEAQLNYPEMQELSFAKQITTDLKKVDTIPVFTVKWNRKLRSRSLKLKNQKKLGDWLKFKLKLDTLVVKGI